MGFGDVTLNSEDKLTSTLKYSSLNKIQLDDLDDKGYVFLCKYSGLESGVFFSKDQNVVQTEITEQLLETVQFISQDALYVTHYYLMSTLR